MRKLHAIAPLCAFLLLAACPDDGDTPDTTTGDASDAQSEAETSEPRSWYRIVVDTEFGEHYEIDRDITDSGIAYSFGSTHIEPAISFAVSEDLSFPAQMNITFNFGIVYESADYPIQTPGTGEYAFDDSPPEIDFTKGLRYRSTVPGASGSITITQWSIETGEIFAGTFQGRLRQDTDQPDKRWADVEGEFHFIVPEPAQGQ